MAKAVSDLLDDPERRAKQSADQFAALDKMGRGGPDPAERAADVVMGFLKRG